MGGVTPHSHNLRRCLTDTRFIFEKLILLMQKAHASAAHCDNCRTPLFSSMFDVAGHFSRTTAQFKKDSQTFLTPCRGQRLRYSYSWILGRCWASYRNHNDHRTRKHVQTGVRMLCPLVQVGVYPNNRDCRYFSGNILKLFLSFLSFSCKIKKAVFLYVFSRLTMVKNK